MRRRGGLVGLAALACAVAACGGGGGGAGAPDAADGAAPDAGDAGDAGDDAGPELPEPTLWPGEDPPALEGPFYAAHPAAFARISRWHTHAVGPEEDRPDLAHRGGFPVGNGYVWGMVGPAWPLATLHSVVGPTYQKRPYYFGDYALRLALAGEEAGAAYDEEWAMQSLSAPVSVTRGRRGEVAVDTVDFAPWTDDPAVRACLVRVVLVRNGGAAALSGARLVVDPHNAVTSPAEGVLVEASEGRVLVSAVSGGGGVAGDGRLEVPLADVAPGAEVATTLVHCAADATPEAAPPPPEVDAGALLDATAAAYGAWLATHATFELPDPRVQDLVDGMRRTLRVQKAATGATSPMHRYTNTWPRDHMGPVLAGLFWGSFEDVADHLDYLYAGVRIAGDFRNAYDADLDTSSLPPEPDWAAMGTLGERNGAETPSYFVWLHHLYWLWTGDTTRAAARMPLFERGMLAQRFSEDHLLPFTGDETFRAAMNVALDLFIEYDHADNSWSSNSSILWLGAARAFADLAAAVGATGPRVAEVAAKTPLVEAAALDRYVLEDGCLAALVSKATGEPSAPFEDVATKVTWARWKEGDDPVARKSAACLLARLGVAPGILQSPPTDVVAGVEGLEGGVHTGMLPGYTLAMLTDVGHPEAEAAFDALRLSASTSGNWQEYHVATDHAGLSLVHDATGRGTNFTPKVRPWEGGINVHAALDYLLGLRPRAADRLLVLRPHLPNGWPRTAWRDLRAGGARFDVEVARTPAGARVTVTSKADEPWTVRLRWDAAGEVAPALAVDGEPVDAAGAWLAFGRASVLAPDVVVPAGGSVVIAAE